MLYTKDQSVCEHWGIRTLIHTLLAKLIHCECGRPIDQRIREMLIACGTSVATVMLCLMLCFGDQIYA